jgi:hypothetical protein
MTSAGSRTKNVIALLSIFQLTIVVLVYFLEIVVSGF